MIAGLAGSRSSLPRSAESATSTARVLLRADTRHTVVIRSARGHVAELGDHDDRRMRAFAAQALGHLRRADERDVERLAVAWRAALDGMARAREQLEDLGAQPIARHVDDDVHAAMVHDRHEA